jgi:hypothetical protein
MVEAGFVFVTGQLATDPMTIRCPFNGIEAQTLR